MRNEIQTRLDEYIEQIFPTESASRKKSRSEAEALGLARISVSPNEARILGLLMSLHQSLKVIEIGTLTGLSAQAILGAMPAGGKLWTFEKNPDHAQRAEAILNALSFSNKSFEVVIGDAQQKLGEIENQGPFDAVFIDGNKAAYGSYLEWTEKNLRSGGLVIADNVFLSGAVWGEETTQKFNTKQIEGMKKFNQRLADPKLYESAILPTSEGLFVAIKR